jgi:ankyrin repeat protein
MLLKKKNYNFFRSILLLSALTLVFSGCGSPAKKQADIEMEGSPPTYTATDKLKALTESYDFGNISRSRRLIKAGADVNVINKYGVTPLFMAAQNGHLEIVILLLKAGADVNIANKESGISPLWIASQQGHSEIIRMLLKAGADVNVTQKASGITPLWMAAQNGHSRIVWLMLEAGADVNAAHKESGITPLWIASQNGRPWIAKLLLGAGADVNLPSGDCQAASGSRGRCRCCP